ncbi:MAG: ABC transporter [Alkaliphilus sp.]|nr:MAG: ABC transporter [Alkaliphilus sp.]
MKVIEISSLTKYYGKSKGIENVNLEVNEGDIFGFIGPNGAGKSTTIRTLMNIIFPTSGSAKIFGMDVVKNSKEIRKNIGYVPSEVYYYDYMTSIEFLEYSASFHNLDAAAKINDLSEKLDLNLEKKISDLSHGNKKKVSIIQAIIHEPKLLILDEPTGGLDPLIQSVFFDILREENEKGTTIFFSSHVLSDVQKLCNRVAIIKDGSIIKTTHISELIEDNFKNIYLELKNVETADFSLKIDGIINKKINGKTATLLYNGDVNLLLSELNKLDLQNLRIEDPSLEEIFMHYYK